MLHLAVLDDPLHQIRRDCEADADGTGGLGARGGGGDRRVDADHLTCRIEGGAARVARVDCGVDLHGVGDDGVVVLFVHHGDGSVQRGDDAGGHGAVVAERIADGHDRLTWRQAVGIRECDGRQVFRRIVELDHGEIGRGIGAHHLRAVDVAVVERHLNLLGAGNHVVVRHDVALFVEDRAGALGFALVHNGLDRHDRLRHVRGDAGPVRRLTAFHRGRAGTVVV